MIKLTALMLSIAIAEAHNLNIEKYFAEPSAF